MPRVELERAKEMYPSTQLGVDGWMEFFRTPAGETAVGQIIYDMWDEVKSAEEYQKGARRVGRRPRRGETPLTEIFAALFPEEFTNDPIPVSLPPLIRQRGLNQLEVSRAAHITPSFLCHIIKGTKTPGLTTIGAIAEAVGVKPHYFPEWRARYVAQLIEELYMTHPHVGITAVKRLRHLRGGQR